MCGQSPALQLCVQVDAAADAVLSVADEEIKAERWVSAEQRQQRQTDEAALDAKALAFRQVLMSRLCTVQLLIDRKDVTAAKCKQISVQAASTVSTTMKCMLLQQGCQHRVVTVMHFVTYQLGCGALEPQKKLCSFVGHVIEVLHCLHLSSMPTALHDLQLCHSHCQHTPNCSRSPS